MSGDFNYCYEEVVQRNIGVLSEEDQKKVRNSGIAVIGLGGQGLQAIISAKVGFGKIVMADRDVFEYTNLNRQLLATVDSVGRWKAEVAQEVIKEHNRLTEVRSLVIDIQTISQAKDILKDVQYFVVAVDDPMSRVVLTRAADKLGITYTVCAPVGWRLFMTSFVPGGPTYEQFTFQPTLGKELTDDLRPILANHQRCFYACSNGFLPTYVEEQLRQKILFNSMFFTSNFLAALSIGEVLKIITGKGKPAIAPDVFTLDLATGRPWDFVDVGIKCIQVREQLDNHGVDAAIEKWRELMLNSNQKRK